MAISDIPWLTSYARTFADHCAGACSPPTACSPGTASNLTSQTSSSACTPCENGKFSAASASTECTSVPAGYRAISGKTNIEQCAAGTVSAFGSGTCSGCSTGRYADAAGLAVCLECPKGVYFAAVSRRVHLILSICLTLIPCPNRIQVYC